MKLIIAWSILIVAMAILVVPFAAFLRHWREWIEDFGYTMLYIAGAVIMAWALKTVIF